jgi:small subunit ribosomal protein S17
VDANNEAINNEAVEETDAQQPATAEDQPVAEAAQGSAEAAEPDAGAEDGAKRTEAPASRRAGASESRAASPTVAKRRGSGRKRVLTGRVVSNKMQKTIVVQIERRKLHPLYKKYITRTKKVKAHDEGNECGIGDLVRVIESRPISKDKRWRLVEILERAK